MNARAAGRVLVTGATGFIGRAVTRRLLAGGERVTVLARARGGQQRARRVWPPPSGAAGRLADLEVVEGDLAEPAAGLGAAARDAPARRASTTVIHCAGETIFFPEDPDRFRAGHVEGPVSLLRLAGRRPPRRPGRSSRPPTSAAGARGRCSRARATSARTFTIPTSASSSRPRRRCARRGRRRTSTFASSVRARWWARRPTPRAARPSNLLFRFIRMAAALAHHAAGASVPLRIEAAPRACFNVVPLGYVARSIVRAHSVSAEHAAEPFTWS